MTGPQQLERVLARRLADHQPPSVTMFDVHETDDPYRMSSGHDTSIYDMVGHDWDDRVSV
jgi:hypothetical protein